ncbi:divergent polysaccharide deacetylase family protein [Enterobacteriaceae bacterium LUAb1]
MFPYKTYRILLVFSVCLLFINVVWAGKLAIVIDDFGYRPKEENKILQMSKNISVAVLPGSTHGKAMAIKAHQMGHEVLIHLPMAPLSKQPLEKDTLRPDMSSAEIERIIREAVNNVPYATGMNNHMGSAMTSSLPGMRKVILALKKYNLYFLDSMTIGNSQVIRAAQGTGVKTLKRRVFLDDNQDEAEIRKQLTRAIRLAQRSSPVIAIGHPHPATVRVLQDMLPSLPGDITLARPGELLHESQHPEQVLPPPTKPPVPVLPDTRDNPFSRVCKAPRALPAVPDATGIHIIVESLDNSDAMHFIRERLLPR